MPLTAEKPNATDSANTTDEGITTEPAGADPIDDLMAETLSQFSELTPPEEVTATDAPATTETNTTTDPTITGDQPGDETDSNADTSDEDEDNDNDNDESATTADDDQAADDADATEEEEEEDDDTEVDSLTPGAQKRIDKLTAQKSRYKEERDEAREKIESLTTELEETQRSAVTLAPTTVNPLANIATEEDLANRRKTAQAVLDWASHPDNRDGATVGDVDYSAEEVADKRRAAEMDLQLHIPKRADWIRDNRQHSQQARHNYPFLFEKGPAGDLANEILSRTPELMERPDYEMVVGAAVIGEAVRQGVYEIVPVKKSSTSKSTPKVTLKSEDAAEPAKSKPAPAPAPAASQPPAAPSRTAPAARPSAPPAVAATRRLADSAGDDSAALADLAESLLD